MPRQARQPSPTGIYHIMLRGNEKKDIFKDPEDKERFLDVFTQKTEYNESVLYAYCIMDNHVHLLLKEETQPISLTMKRIGISYAYYYNQKHNTVGHVFQGRFRSENVEDDRYLLSVIRYIHNNPEKAGICNKEKYHWSSYTDYIGEQSKFIYDFVIDKILSLFSLDKETAVKQFRLFSDQAGQIKHIDIEQRKYTNINEYKVNKYINKFLDKRKITIGDLKKATFRETRNELLINLRNNTDLSLRKISELTGINREVVRTYFLSREPSP